MTDDPIKQAEALMRELSRAETRLNTLKAAKDRKIGAIVDQYTPMIDPLTERRDEIMDQIAALWTANEDIFTKDGKTLVLRSGTISSRTAAEALVIEDEAKVINGMRRKGLLRRFTRVGKRTINKVELKKHPEVVAALPGISIEQSEYVSVTPAKTGAELKRSLNPFRRRTK